MKYQSAVEILSILASRVYCLKMPLSTVFIGSIPLKRAWWPPIFIAILDPTWLFEYLCQASLQIYGRFFFRGITLKLSTVLLFGVSNRSQIYVLANIWMIIVEKVLLEKDQCSRDTKTWRFTLKKGYRIYSKERRPRMSAAFRSKNVNERRPRINLIDFWDG